MIKRGSFKLGRGEFAFDDWKFDRNSNVIYINNNSYFWNEERSDHNAAQQLYEALVRKMDFGPRDWGTVAWDVPMGLAKTFGGYFTATAGVAASATVKGAVVGVPMYIYGTSAAAEGISQIFGKSGGTNLYGSLAYEYGGDIGESIYYTGDAIIGVIGIVKVYNSINSADHLIKVIKEKPVWISSGEVGSKWVGKKYYTVEKVAPGYYGLVIDGVLDVVYTVSGGLDAEGLKQNIDRFGQ